MSEKIKEYNVNKIYDLHKVTYDILKTFPDARVFFLKGNLGSGKTTLIQSICTSLQTEEQVVSPSFSLVNIYNSKIGEIYHLDLYRLTKVDEAIDLGIEDYLYSGNYCFIEWPELIENIYTTPLITINIDITEIQKRKISLFKQ
ncbi:MAG: tRNA (adenosine(37)-N6)-threonylcarbamoyltransferase complex ATPase subunit type 1 TsaE [Saprospiraceae bacterium]